MTNQPNLSRSIYPRLSTSYAVRQDSLHGVSIHQRSIESLLEAPSNLLGFFPAMKPGRQLLHPMLRHSRPTVSKLAAARAVWVNDLAAVVATSLGLIILVCLS